LEASGVPTAAGFKGAAEAAEAKSAVAPITERIVFMITSYSVFVERSATALRRPRVVPLKANPTNNNIRRNPRSRSPKFRNRIKIV
jgi:hypothetical protein